MTAAAVWNATWWSYPGDSVLQLILVVIAIALALAPFVVIVQTVGWIIGQHSFPDGDMWIAAGVGVVVWIFALAVMLNPGDPAMEPRPRRKRYVMRGYGGGKNATSLHPRQAKQGKRIVYIPGVGYRHVKAGRKQ